MYGISEINKLSKDEWCQKFNNVIEHYPKAAEEMEKQRPFENTEKLILAFDDYLEKLPETEKELILKLHPDLAGRLLDEGNLTPESQKEQEAAGLHNLSLEEKKLMTDLNNRYKEKFGFPFVIVARENKAAAILDGLQFRLQNSRSEELIAGINQVKGICRLRILNFTSV